MWKFGKQLIFNSFILQYDNDISAVKTFLDSVQLCGFPSVMDWPPQILDLNIAATVWTFDRKLNKRQPKEEGCLRTLNALPEPWRTSGCVEE